MSIGEMSVGELSVGELSVGEMSIGELSVGEMSGYRAIQLLHQRTSTRSRDLQEVKGSLKLTLQQPKKATNPTDSQEI